jgi:cyclohexanecarboxylate-CoA ligase
VNFNAILPESRVSAMKEGGFWRDQVLTDFLDRAVAERSNALAIVGYNSETDQQVRLSYGELAQRVDLVALNLARLGVRHGDVVSCQLPAWWEFAVIHLACLRLGAATNAVMPIFRERELEFMLGLAESKVFIIPTRFRGADYPAIAAGVRDKLPRLKHVLEVGGTGLGSFERELLGASDGLESYRRHLARPTANEVIQLLFTSGTTGEPKCVMHTSNTLLTNLLTQVNRLGLTHEDAFLICTPIAHQIGFCYGLSLSIAVGGKVVMQDAWSKERAAELVKTERVTMITGSPPILADLNEVATQRPGDFASMRYFLASGAPIPPILVQRTSASLGAIIISGWGMTENLLVTTTDPTDSPRKAFETDGRALPGSEVRVVDENGQTAPPHREGRLQTRGCTQFVGYLKRPQWHGTDAEGWFDTGDMARIDEDGFIRITGRSKDIVIRGGEKIPVLEVEGLLYQHPDVFEVSIVAVPDARLGERACAFVVPRDGKTLMLEDIAKFLASLKVAKQYVPERLEIVTELPKTASGKVQKFLLREIAKSNVHEAA